MTDGYERRFDGRSRGLVAMAIAWVAATTVVATTWKSVRDKPVQRKIRITGSAKKRITSNLIEWSATVDARAMDRTRAYKECKSGVDRVVAFLVKEGIKPDEIRPEAASFNPEFEVQHVLVGKQNYDKQIPAGFTTRQAVTVRSTDLALVERASREVTSLLEEGVSVTSADPRYFYTRLGELKLEMLAAAGRDARARADNILRSTGGASVGRLISADMGIININPANSTKTSEEGNNDTSSLEKDIITIIHADYELN